MTWQNLDTRRGQLLEMAATLERTTDSIAAVMRDYPEEVVGSGWLEEAARNIERAQAMISYAAANADTDRTSRGGRAMGDGTWFAVVCRWRDYRPSPLVEGHEAIVVEAADADEALLVARSKRPDLWEIPAGRFFRETAVHPAQVVSR